MITKASDAPTCFFVRRDEKGRDIIVDHHGFIHSREDVQELLGIAQGHLDIFPTEQIILDANVAHDEHLRELDRLQREQPSTEPKKPKEGFVYLCRNNRNGLVKIGFSTNPRKRERTLQSEEPELEFVHIFKGTVQDEEALHLRYYQSRKRGEWFDLAWHDLQAIMGKSADD